MSKYNTPYALDSNAHLRSKDKKCSLFQDSPNDVDLWGDPDCGSCPTLCTPTNACDSGCTQCTSNLDYDQTSQWSWFITSPLEIIDQGQF